MKKTIIIFIFSLASFLQSEAQNTLPKYDGTFGKKELQHLLRRTMFGATLDDLKYFEGKSMDAVVEELLTLSTQQPEPPLWHLKYDYGDSASFKVGMPWIGKKGEKAWTQSIIQNNVNYWWHGLMLQQDRNIREKMTLFLESHVPSNNGKNNEAQGLYYYNRVKLLRENALGNYKEFMKKVTLEPSMLFYLDMNGSFAYNWVEWHYNKKKVSINPSENYARELQEIYTVGKGKNNNEQLFTEDDVKAAADVLSGWFVCNNKDGSVVKTICNNNQSYNTEYNEIFHSDKNKQFSSFYNNKLITYKAGGTGGKQEIDELFDMLFARKETSENIVRKLYRYFVYAYISDDTETNVIQPLAKIFRDNNFEIKPVLKAMFTSEHFYDKEQVGVMIKNPYDYCAGLMRMMGVEFYPKKDTLKNGNLANYSIYQALNGATFSIGMSISQVPDVAGWPAYYQSPDYHHNWINADLMRRRKEFVFYVNPNNQYWTGMLTNSRKWTDFTIDKDPLTLSIAERFDNTNDSESFVQQNIDYFLVKDLSDAEKMKLKSILEDTKGSGNITISWKNAWDGYKSNPSSNNYLHCYFKLLKFYEALFGYAEFQLM